MIRQETPTHWLLVTHPDHADVAGQFADAWGNDRFAPPKPYDAIRYAVYHHDDGWLARDTAPVLTKDNRPEAFTRQLVGAYSAFEEIDLPSYLKVRGDATAAVAAVDPAAAIFVSMHTYNLLSEQADVNTIRPEHRQAHADFLSAQLAWQQQTAAQLGLDQSALQRGFEFLQCCDNLSLIVCSGYDVPRDLRHTHPDRSGQRHAIRCTPVNPALYTLDPWISDRPEIVLEIPYRSLAKSACGTLSAFQSAWNQAPLQRHRLMLRPAR
ncbi:DUF3891 family protein [Rariglobus hedericola]|uniref:DUF3891 family protein n=1 Tax=Rariglobus hedericola TaxID=2597822 RepID=A0A556QMQ0_9BACT|nr:DUF3891 family protein [Rariglobus hedericola]TSJ77930.1 DUF3891 family protein [Rariglobus hedericola]